MPRKRHRARKIPKIYSPNIIISERGVNLVQRRVLEMGYIWNVTHVEAGIDGEIEIVTGNNAATNCVIRVQVKAVQKEFQSNSKDAFSFSCEQRDIDYWLAGNAPNILVICRPTTEEAYWVDLKAYFTRPENHGSVTIRFAKTHDVFDTRCAPALRDLAVPRTLGLYASPQPHKESLLVNLFPIQSFPSHIYSAETQFRFMKELLQKLKEDSQPEVREWFLNDKRLYTIHDLRTHSLGAHCSRESAQVHEARVWAETNDPVLKKQFVRLLDLCFRQLCWSKGIVFNRKPELYYFKAPKDLADREIGCRNLEKQSTQTVFKCHRNKLELNKIEFCRHHGFERRFYRFAELWYITVTPTYFFSEDGIKPHRSTEVLQANVKRLDRHRAVLSQLLMWSEVLANPAGMFDRRYTYLRLGTPLELPLPLGIDDETWRGSKVGEEDEISDVEELLRPNADLDEEQMQLWT